MSLWRLVEYIISLQWYELYPYIFSEITFRGIRLLKRNLVYATISSHITERRVTFEGIYILKYYQNDEKKPLNKIVWNLELNHYEVNIL